MNNKFVYVLLLEDNKIYVGKSINPEKRIKQHFSDNYSSSWTNKYKPLSVLKTYSNCDDFDEDKITKIYMEKYGIENVRGGSYSTVFLSKQSIQLLRKEINMSKDLCYKCNLSGHFGKNCDKEDFIFIKICSECNREGHSSSECYAKTYIEYEDNFSLDVAHYIQKFQKKYFN